MTSWNDFTVSVMKQSSCRTAVQLALCRLYCLPGEKCTLADIPLPPWEAATIDKIPCCAGSCVPDQAWPGAVGWLLDKHARCTYHNITCLRDIVSCWSALLGAHATRVQPSVHAAQREHVLHLTDTRVPSQSSTVLASWKAWAHFMMILGLHSLSRARARASLHASAAYSHAAQTHIHNRNGHPGLQSAHRIPCTRPTQPAADCDFLLNR